MSLLSWERGLKLLLCCIARNNTASLLSWERGLKYADEFGFDFDDKVAPLVGAWIEILISGNSTKGSLVAPLVGAWIEMAVRS